MGTKRKMIEIYTVSDIMSYIYPGTSPRGRLSNRDRDEVCSIPTHCFAGRAELPAQWGKSIGRNFKPQPPVTINRMKRYSD